MFTIVSIVLHFMIRFVFVGGVLDQIYSVVGINAVFGVLYFYLTSLAKPSFDSRGNIEDAGQELNGENLTAYMFDISSSLFILLRLINLYSLSGLVFHACVAVLSKSLARVH